MFPRQTAQKIRNDYLKNQEDYFEVAKIIAKKDAEAIGENLKNFNLTEPQKYEVAKLAAKQNPVKTLKILTLFRLIQSHFNEIHESIMITI